MQEENREKTIYKVTWVGFFVNLVLSIAKLLAGIFGKSGAMIADAVHSISDFATDLVVLVFVRVAAKPKDENHDYGHGKFETIATIIIGLALFAVAVGIFINSFGLVGRVLKGEVIERPGLIALIAAVVSIVTKEWLYWYTLEVAKRVNSPAVKANAWHHRSDAFSSIGTLFGIGGAYFLGDKWRVLDPVAAIIVSLLIAKVAYDLVMPSLNELVERSLPKEQEDEILALIMQDPSLSDPHNLKTRRIGSNIAIEVHVRVPGDMTVEKSHNLTVNIEQKLKEKYGVGTQVIIHIEPVI
ncbi:MAG TPA: cation diffusion facilitator family transporter [Paludibacteraceae bacterium]|nr:cation diffusion facilitator family transporter [Paludibacteraceae bacterium]HQB68906.1 cation diffusion facilitator family transporter [Paludibacteraceae bacterium]HRS67214.1 cation diffusion facilitator family transporter [Paludibacteraceae bacterium]